MATVLIVGTGTIGQPLARAILKLKKQFDIDELMFLKNSPREEDIGMVKRFQEAGAKLCVYQKDFQSFIDIGLMPDYHFEDALKTTTVLIDCSKDDLALKLKESYYTKCDENVLGFIAQGGAKKFGKPFAYDINNDAIAIDERFIQVVSCNTHNLLAILKTLVLDYEGISNLEQGRFNLQRRISDISQKKGILGMEVGIPGDSIYGSHQAADAVALLKTIGIENINIHSRANKVPNAYMHVIEFNLKLKKTVTKEEIINRFKKNPLTATTLLTSNNLVLSAGRDWGHFGRILNQTVVCLPSIEVIGGNEVIGACFTPQDGNSLISSMAALLFFLDQTKNKEKWIQRVKTILYRPPFLFNEV
jgi:glyceraldehyde-3-phosphate dehydrogenase type II